MLEATIASARVTSRLEFGDYPELMAQFPVRACNRDDVQALRTAMLEVETLLENQSSDPMPVALATIPTFSCRT